MSSERAKLLFANDAFYQAFADGDTKAMQEIWSQREDISCFHPGWSALIGRDAVMRSWQSILEGEPTEIECVVVDAAITGESARVSCYEKLPGAVLLATNLFIREDGAWKLTHHHAGPTAEDLDLSATEEEAPGSDAVH